MTAEPRFATPRTPGRKTWGPEVCRIMVKLGWDPMPWQRQVLDVALEHEDGELVYRDVWLEVPRQAGKTSIQLGLQVHRATQMARRFKSPQRTLYLAQKQQDAATKLVEEHWPIIEASPFGVLGELIRQTGNQGLKWSNGSYHHVAAPTAKAGHGGSLDLVQLDEAFVHIDNRVEQGTKPTQITRRSPQFWVTSAAGTQTSTYLLEKVNVGRENVRQGVRSGVAYFEWSAAEDADPTDRRVWAATHPAIGHTIRVRDLEADFKAMELAEFARAYLGIWPTRTRPRVIAEALWAACWDAASEMVDPVHFAIDVAPDRSWAAVGVAGRTLDGHTHVELIDHEEGTGWVVDRVQHLLDRHPGSTLAMDTVGAATSLLPELERRKVPVRLLTTTDVGRAAGHFLDLVTTSRLRHLDQAPVNAALAAATKRMVGERWSWGRDSSVSICPLVGLTLAAWSLETAPERKRHKMGLIR